MKLGLRHLRNNSITLDVLEPKLRETQSIEVYCGNLREATCLWLHLYTEKKHAFVN